MKETIHTRLKRFRTRRGLSIKTVSALSGIPISTYKEWENGRQIRGEPYPILAEALQVTLQELITGEKPQAGRILERMDRLQIEIESIKKDLISLI